MLVRSVTLDDFEQLWELIQRATYGLTTLQISREQLRERVEISVFAFRRQTEKPTGEPYVFVMEDSASGELVGLSCIFSKTGGYEPFYSYRRVIETKHCDLLSRSISVESLQLAKIHDGPTEIGSLFLRPSHRGNGNGRLLSLARFAFMAAHRQRFDKQVIAEMRGVMSDDGVCPFWEAIGRHFFGMDFPQADNLSTLNKRFIEDLMPEYPIYTRLLPESARKIMGDVHVHTKPALAMLQSEGFQVTDLIDIFDGGPVVQCSRDSIDAVRRTVAFDNWQVAANDGTAHIVSSDADGFRAVLANADVDLAANTLTIDPQSSKLLSAEQAKQLRVMPLYPKKQASSS